MRLVHSRATQKSRLLATIRGLRLQRVMATTLAKFPNCSSAEREYR